MIKSLKEKQHKPLDPFERSLREYRERNWDPSDFSDLPDFIQKNILHRAQQIREKEDRLNMWIAA